MTRRSHGLADRPGEPYPATFRIHLHQVESRGIEPRFPPCHSGVFPLDHDPVSGAPGNRTITLLHVTQASSPLDHGIMSVTRVGVEPTKSPRPQLDRFTCLRTWSFRKWRVRGSHPAVRTYEAPMSTGPPASCRSRYRAGLTGLMKASWAPAASASCFRK